jgi:LmbE family N-acetylglucosaminyl deacetylase
VTTAPVPAAAAPGRVLAVGAHPDDIEFGCGATLAKWARAGAHVQLLVLTDGSKGTWQPDQDLAELVAVRRDEQRAAARTLGAHDVHFLDAVDGELEADAHRRQEVCAVIRATRPDVVLGHDPWKRYRLHPDHRRAGELVIDGIVAARDPHFFPAAGTPHRPTSLLLFEAQEVDHVEAVTEADIESKIAALLCHKSQWRSTMHIEIGTGDEQEQRAAFEASVRTEITDNEGEAFKRITDL